MQQFDIQICLVSGQPTPNLVPVLANEFRPGEKVILIVSKEMKERANFLNTVFKQYGISCQQEFLDDAYNIELIQKQLENLISDLKDQKKNFVVNVTGGTKPMAIAAQAACYYSNSPCFYIHPDTNEIQFYTPDGEVVFYNIQNKLTLKDYLEVHGYKIEKAEDSNEKPDKQVQRLLDILIREPGKFSDSIGALNWLASEAKKAGRLTVTIRNQGSKFYELLDYFREAGLLSLQGNEIQFSNENARFFANGGWLEDYVFNMVRQLDLQDCKKNLTVTKHSEQKSKNEIDVACLARNRLFLIECKTRNFLNKNASILGKETLYRLDSLTALGGLNTNGMLISYRPLNDATRNRAKDLRIRVLEGKQLDDLKNHLNTWIKS